MTGTRSRATSKSSSLLQDVPGTFPSYVSTEQDYEEEAPPILTLPEAVYARRAEYLKSKHVRIKIGTWNVAAHKGTPDDLGGWFVGGKGVSEALAGLSVTDQSEPSNEDAPAQPGEPERERVSAQEARVEREHSTIPLNDPGSVLPSHDEIDLYVLGLQEIVDIGSATEALRPYTDPTASLRWKIALEASLPKGYALVAEQQLVGLLLLVYASPELSGEIKSISTTSVGTGLMGYMGNKGAVTARIVLGDTTRLVFINSHLASGADKASLERRNWDVQQIFHRTRFEPIKDAMDLNQNTGEQIGDEDFAFWIGDLNYRLEGIPGDDVRRLLLLHTRNQYDLSQRSKLKIDEEIKRSTESESASGDEIHRFASASSASAEESAEPLDNQTLFTLEDDDDDESAENPNSLQATLSSLLPHDELRQQMNARKVFQDGWREGEITFMPTYKYDVGSMGVFDSSEKKRAPSWCDRILFRSRRSKLAYEARVREEETARKKDEEMKANGTDHAGDDDEILYDYDPDTDGGNTVDDYDENDEYDEFGERDVATNDFDEDEIMLEHYIAHQRVLSSDHKPLNAVFTLRYDAVVPELKTKVHAEVVKDLDKAENEGRPNVTIVVDQHGTSQSKQCEQTQSNFEGVWFGSVRWAQAKHRGLTIANTSRVQASFSFIERPVGSDQTAGIAPSWLNLKSNGTELSSSSSSTVPVTIEPGETTSVELEIRVLDITLAQAFNNGSKKLDDVLVLRVESGRDHFIPVRAKWLETSLGRSIDKLIRIPEGGIRKLQNQRPDCSKTDSSAVDVEQEEPVRFSAPRELFRLTEAIEELGTRIVAEWDMISSDSPANAPWAEHPAWPFDDNCWTEASTSHWQEGLSDACNALDTDEDIETSLQQDLPRIQQLYVLASLLLLFLQSMPDGIIDEELWMKIEMYLVEIEKLKRKPTNEELRTAIQEILSQSPSHSISFVLIMTMLERITNEVDGSSRIHEEQHPKSPKSPISPTFKQSPLRRVATLGRLPAESHKERASHALAKIFASAMTRIPTGSNSDKNKAGREKRRAWVVETFLKRDDVG